MMIDILFFFILIIAAASFLTYKLIKWRQFKNKKSGGFPYSRNKKSHSPFARNEI